MPVVCLLVIHLLGIILLPGVIQLNCLLDVSSYTALLGKYCEHLH